MRGDSGDEHVESNMKREREKEIGGKGNVAREVRGGGGREVGEDGKREEVEDGSV